MYNAVADVKIKDLNKGIKTPNHHSSQQPTHLLVKIKDLNKGIKTQPSSNGIKVIEYLCKNKRPE